METREEVLSKGRAVLETCNELIEVDPENNRRYLILKAYLAKLDRAIVAVESNAPHSIFDNPLHQIPLLIDEVEKLYSRATARL